jgi:hypothetical protein
MRLLKFTSLLAVAAVIAAPAIAQQGEQRPRMMTPPPPAPDQASVASSAFSSAYRRAGNPRIVIFWNRAFDDEVASTYRTTTDWEEHNDGNGNSYGRSSTGDERQTSKRRDLVDEPVDWDMEGAFNSTMSGAGARLVDRASIMRTQGAADGAEERANVQGIETRAVTGKADITVEILSTVDSRSSQGISYRITARDVRNATILADFTTTGRPPTPRMGLVAGPDGFERAKPPEPGPEDFGQQLAVELMQALSRKLR